MVSPFSQRLPHTLGDGAASLATELERACERGAIDLTLSNPTQCGFAYPREALVTALAQPAALVYDPAPLGMAAARGAVSAYLQSRFGVEVAWQQVMLTASTSEAYSFLFKLLCDPGDAVAIAYPSYPLLQHLAELEGVRTRRYAWVYNSGWHIDWESLEEALRAGVKAVVVVQPNNPTGSCLDAAAAVRLKRACVRYGAALVADEVFAPYHFTAAPNPSLAAQQGGRSTQDDAEPLLFVLDGLSKGAGLPQLKLAWTAVYGPPALRQAAVERLSWIADSYLSVGSPVQHAVAPLLKSAPLLQRQIQQRVRDHREALQRLLAAWGAARAGIELLEASGGWYAVLRLPQLMGDDDLVRELAEHDAVVLHPGFFYDFPQEGHLVLSLLPAADLFGTGVQRLMGGLERLGFK